MVTTITATTLSAAEMGTDMGIIATAALISFLVIKELSNSAAVTELDNAKRYDRWYRFKTLAGRVNIFIYPLLFIFAMIVTYRVMDVLCDGFTGSGFWAFSN